MRDVQCGSRGRFIRGRSDALIERHHDVAADRLLRFDADLRAEQDRPPVEVALKDRALLAHRARMRQRENLKSAGVGEHRALPTHESMDAARAAKHFGSRPQQEMVSISEQDLRARILERLWELRLHRGLRADRHEERRLHRIVQSAKRGRARTRARSLRLKAKM